MSDSIIVTSNEPKPAAAQDASLGTSAQTEETPAVSDENTSEEITENSADSENQDLGEDSETDSDDSNDQADEDQQVQEQKPKPKNGFKKKIGKLQSERDFWKEEALKARQAGNQPQQNQQADPQEKPANGLVKPDPNKYDSYDKYIEDLTDYKVKLFRQEDEAKNQQRQIQSEHAKRTQTFEEKISEFKKTAQDFDEVISEIEDVNGTPALHDAILSSDLGPKLLYELAKNPKELERINSLPPAAVYKEIGKLEAKFEQKSSPAPVVKTTNAPRPIKPVGANSTAASTKSIYDENISQAEYERRRAAEIKRNRGA